MNLRKSFSKKWHGSMKLTDNSDYDKSIIHNRELFLDSFSIPVSQLITPQIVHGNNVTVVYRTTPGVVQNTDALLTNQKNIFLSITVADCLPIYLHDQSSSTIGIIHAGWRGLTKDIIKKTITKAQNELQLDPSRTHIAIGPSIGVCHFEVQQDVADQFKEYPIAVLNQDGKMYLDLKLVAKTQLINTGIQENNIEISPICTYEDENFFSYRRDKSNPVEAMIAIIGVKN